MDDQIINTSNWMFLKENKTGVKILSSIPVGYTDATHAYFKYPIANPTGPICANEFIAARLGQKLELPINKTQFKNFDGIDGVLIEKSPGEVNMWRNFPFKDDLARTLDSFDLLIKTVVFDIFIENLDRNPDNIIYSRIRNKKYDFYLIDHSISLYGSSPQPLDYNAFPFSSMVQIEELRKLFNKGFDIFKGDIQKITELDDVYITELVNSVPENYLSSAQKNSIKDLLINRKSMIYNKIETFCNNVTW